MFNNGIKGTENINTELAVSKARIINLFKDVMSERWLFPRILHRVLR